MSGKGMHMKKRRPLPYLVRSATTLIHYGGICAISATPIVYLFTPFLYIGVAVRLGI